MSRLIDIYLHIALVHMFTYRLYNNYMSIITRNALATPQFHPPVMRWWSLSWSYSTSADILIGEGDLLPETEMRMGASQQAGMQEAKAQVPRSTREKF